MLTMESEVPLVLDIGDVKFSLPPGPAFCRDRFRGIYAPFVFPTSDITEKPHIVVTAQPLSRAPAFDKMQPVYETGLEWRLFQDGGYRYFVFGGSWDRQGGGKAARVPHDWSEVTMLFSEAGMSPQTQMAFAYSSIQYPVDQLLTMSILVRERTGVLLHAACAVMRGLSYVFPGPSGAGKSTLTARIGSVPGVTCVNDDRVIVREDRGEFRTWGTPWPGEAGVALNRNDPLGGILFPQKGDEDRLVPLSRTAALKRLLPTVSIPMYDAAAIDAVLEFLEKLVFSVPVFDMLFVPDGEIGQLLLRELPGNAVRETNRRTESGGDM